MRPNSNKTNIKSHPENNWVTLFYAVKKNPKIKKTPKNEEKPNRGGRRLLSLKVYEKNIFKNPRGFCFSLYSL